MKIPAAADWNLALPIAMIVASVLAVAFVIIKVLKRMAPPDQRLTLVLIVIYGAFVTITRLGFSWNPRYSEWFGLLYSLENIVTGVALFAISLLVIRTLWPQLLARPRVRLSPLGRDAIDTYVKEILDSNSFMTALNESLPRGADDAEYGLDSVPYLLSSIRSRRERLNRSTRGFLRLTVIAATATALIISFFAWVLVNDESVGAPRALRSLRESTDSLATSLRYLNSDYRGSTEFARLTRAINGKVDPANVPIKAKLQAILRNAAAGEPLSDFITALRPVAGELRYDTPRYGSDVDSAMEALDAQNTERRAALERIEQLQPRLSGLIDRVSEELGKDQNRIAEVVRRIALGLIVSTFFLAIVRFVANLYRADYNQLLRADFDDMLVRSFYVTFKASEGMGNQRAAVLSSYISALSTFAPLQAAAEEKGLSKEDSDLLKEILAAAAKKL
ncbi:MAG: hypothetical protein WB973_10365 [Thermoanaerobaculia bacterium]